MTEQLETQDVQEVTPDLPEQKARPKKSKTTSPLLPPLPRLRLKTGEVLGLPEGMGIVYSETRRLLMLSMPDENQDVLYDVEVLELADRLPFGFEEREKRVAHQILVPRAGRVMTDDKVLENGYFTWDDLTCNGRWIPRDGEITRNAIAMARRMEEVREKLGSPEVRVAIWYAPKALRIFDDDPCRIYAQHHTGQGVHFSVEGMEAKAVQKTLDPWWDGGMGCGEDFTYLDDRGYKARWIFLSS
ncbi:MAG: hypothetical protein AB4290_26340 [Spirulina sp.]